jgi:Nitrile hydratase, alpha chain
VVGAAKKGERAMSQAAAGGGTGRAEMERSIVQRSMEDDSFRQRLLEDPKATVEQELETQLPEDVEVSVVEESQQTIYLVLPFRSADLPAGELSDQQLEAVAGGKGTAAWSDCSTCAHSCSEEEVC